MATVGKGVYADAVHTFFDGLRSYDVERACSVLAPEVNFESPWGNRSGVEATKELLTNVCADAATRPSFTIKDIGGDGRVVRLQVSVSHRFGYAPELHTFHMLMAQGQLHDVLIRK